MCLFGEGLPYTAALLANGLCSGELGSVYNLTRGPVGAEERQV